MPRAPGFGAGDRSSLRLGDRADLAGAEPSDDIRVRVNPNFYDDFALCDEDISNGANDGRLSGDLTNEDLDVRLGSVAIAQGAWFHVTEASHSVGPLSFDAGTLPSSATVMRFRLRVRDDAFAQGREVFIDDVRGTQP